MRLLKSTSLLIALCIISFSINGQQLDHRLGQFLVSFDTKEVPEGFIEAGSIFEGIPTSLRIAEQVSPFMNIYKVTFDHTKIHEYRYMEALRKLKDVRIVQVNHFVYERETIPNDPEFGTQWQWQNFGSPGLNDADIDCELAWDITTGGLTADGDSIVVAIIDGGTDLSHPDLMDNHWYNYAEIPDNGIDDDNNGYVDDYYGWNAYSDNDDVDFGGHGTNVEGMIGAVGNNETGVTGVNWQVQLMTIRGSSGDEATVISAYSYALSHRKKYNETDGEEGAFVVATNSSFGVNFGQPENAPLWCSFYDTLGVYGILSCGATANLDINIDIEGDLPTACPSEYLLSVTATNNADVRTFSGYGIEQVDLGAPGEDIYTTALGGGYTFTSGTSFASPTVAGVIALLYSAPCSNLMSVVKDDPGLGALMVRDYIFQGVDAVENLESETKYGGRVNVNNALNLLLENCGPCPKPTSIKAVNKTDVSVELTWKTNDSIATTALRYREVGAMDWIEVSDAMSPFPINDLFACTDYEVQLEGMCSDTLSGYTNSFVFKTDGCCDRPANTVFTEIGEKSISIAWDPVLAANKFVIQYKLVEDAEWNEIETNSPNETIDGLVPCSSYELRIMTDCDTAQTDFIEIIEFNTPGCGACQDLTYCEYIGQNSSLEYIESVQINEDIAATGNNDGYGNFIGAPISEILIGIESTIDITPGFPGTEYNEQYNAWIDYNQDGEFTDEELIATTAGIAVAGTFSETFLVPESAKEGITRLRVAMNFGGATVGSCGSFFSGEVEDHCINMLNPFIPCATVPILDTSNISFTSIHLAWDSIPEAIAYLIRYKETSNNEWEDFAELDTSYLLSDLKPCTEYEVQILSVCPSDTSAYSQSLIFNTDCNSTHTIDQPLSQAKVYPTIFSDYLWLEFGGILPENYEAILVDQQGKLIKRIEIASHTQKLQINPGYGLSSGLYYLKVYNQKESKVFKVLKQ